MKLFLKHHKVELCPKCKRKMQDDCVVDPDNAAKTYVFKQCKGCGHTTFPDTVVEPYMEASGQRMFKF